MVRSAKYEENGALSVASGVSTTPYKPCSIAGDGAIHA